MATEVEKKPKNGDKIEKKDMKVTLGFGVDDPTGAYFMQIDGIPTEAFAIALANTIGPTVELIAQQLGFLQKPDSKKPIIIQ